MDAVTEATGFNAEGFLGSLKSEDGWKPRTMTISTSTDIRFFTSRKMPPVSTFEMALRGTFSLVHKIRPAWTPALKT